MFPTRLAVADMLDIPFQVEIGKRKAWIWLWKEERSVNNILGGIKQYKGIVILSDFT